MTDIPELVETAIRTMLGEADHPVMTSQVGMYLTTVARQERRDDLMVHNRAGGGYMEVTGAMAARWMERMPDVVQVPGVGRDRRWALAGKVDEWARLAETRVGWRAEAVEKITAVHGRVQYEDVLVAQFYPCGLLQTTEQCDNEAAKLASVLRKRYVLLAERGGVTTQGADL